MDETDPDARNISFDRGVEGPFEDSEVVTGQEIESSNRHNKDNFKPPDNMDTSLNNSPYDNSDNQLQKITAPDDQDQKDNSDYNDANKDVTNDHDVQDSANYQDNQDNSDDQDASCSSDENSNQDTSCSDNFSNAEGEFRAAGHNENNLTDQHDLSYPVDLATFPDDQAVDYSAAFPSNKLTINSSTTATATLPETDPTVQPPEPDNVGTNGPCHLAKSFSDFPGFSACLADNAKQQSESTKTTSLNCIARGTDLPQSSSGFHNILLQHGDDSSLEKTAAAKDPPNDVETLQSDPPSPHETNSVPASNDSSPPATINSNELSAQNLEATSETSEAMDAEPIQAPVVQYAFRQLRSRSVALQPSLTMKPRQARGRRRTTSNANSLNQEGQCQSLPPVCFSVPTASGSETTSIAINFSSQDRRPRSASPSCFSLPADRQKQFGDRLASPNQVATTSTMANSIPNLNSEASILSQDSSKRLRNGQSSSADGDVNLPAPLTPSVSTVSEVSAQCSSSPSSPTSSNDDPAAASTAAAVVTASTSYASNSLPAQKMPPSQHGSGASSKPESSFGHDVINILQDDDSRCESSETTDESSFPKRKKRMKLKATKKRVCKYFSDSSDEEEDQTNVQPSTSFETISDQYQHNSASTSHSTGKASVNTVSCIQENATKYDAFSESSFSDLGMQVDTGAESEADVLPSDMGVSNQKINSSHTVVNPPKDVCEDTLQNLISEDHFNVVIDENLTAVESEVTVECSLIETDPQTTPLIHERRSSRIIATEKPSDQPNTDSEPASNKHAKSTAECEGKQSRRRFKRTKTRHEELEDAQATTAKEESGSAEHSASCNFQATSPHTPSAPSQSVKDESTPDELPDIDPKSQQAHSNAQQDYVSDTSAVAVAPVAEPSAATTSSTAEHSEQQHQKLVTKDLLLWKRRLAKYEQLLCERENMTTDTEDSSECFAQRQVWVGMRDYYRAKIDSVENGAAAVAPLDGAGSSTAAAGDGLPQANAGNRTEQHGESSSTSSTKPKKLKKHRSRSSDRRRRNSAPEDHDQQIQQSSVSSTAAASVQQHSDGLPAEEDDDDEQQHNTSVEVKLPLLSSRSTRNDVDAGPSGRGVDDEDAVIVDSEDDNDEANKADEGGCSSSSRKGSSWRDRDWLSLRKRPKHVYRKRRGANKGGADADVVDLTNEVESDPDNGDVEVLQHDKPVVYLKTENRRKRRRAARLCAHEGSFASNAAAAQTIDISNNDATPPPPPVDMNDPNILFGMLLDLPKGYQLPLAPSKDEEDEEERARGGSSNTDGERAARLCHPSGPDLLEAVCMAQESKHLAGGEGGNQAGCSRDSTLAGGSSYGPRWGAASPTTPPAFESTSGGGGCYSGVTSTSSGSGGHYNGASGDLGFGFGAGPSTSSSGGGGGGGGSAGGGRVSEKTMYMEKLWEHLDVPAEDIPQCRLRQSVVDQEVPSNFDYDCTNSPPYPSPFASGAGGHGHNSGAGPSSGTGHSASQYGDVGKFESESRATRRRVLAFQPGTSINLAGTSSVNSNGAADSSNSTSLNVLPRNNPFRHSHRLRNPGFLGESSASNPLPEGPSDRLGASSSQANDAPDDQGSLSSSSSGNVGHNRAEPVPKLHLIRRSQLWESSSTTPSTSGTGGTPMFSRSQSTPIHVSSPLDLSSIPGPSHRRGVFAPPGGLNQDAVPAVYSGPTGQLMGDHFGSAYGYNHRHPHGLFGRPYLERVDEEARNAAAVASILPPSSSNNAESRAPGNRLNNYDHPNNNSGRSMTDYFWLPNLHPEDIASRNANYSAGSGSSMYSENGRAAAGSSGSNNTRNNNSDVQFLAANLPDSLMDDGTDEEVLPSNVAAHGPTNTSSRGLNPSTSDGGQRGGDHRPSTHYRSQPSFEEPQLPGSSSTPFLDQPSTSCGGGGGGGDSGNNVEISCPICLDTLTEIKAGPSHLVSTVCGHLFCNGCLEPAVRRTKQCPTCRRKLTKKQYHKVYL